MNLPFLTASGMILHCEGNGKDRVLSFRFGERSCLEF